jgi:hypothetical protein
LFLQVGRTIAQADAEANWLDAFWVISQALTQERREFVTLVFGGVVIVVVTLVDFVVVAWCVDFLEWWDLKAAICCFQEFHAMTALAKANLVVGHFHFQYHQGILEEVAVAEDSFALNLPVCVLHIVR